MVISGRLTLRIAWFQRIQSPTTLANGMAPTCFYLADWRIGSRKRPYLFRITSSSEATAVFTAFAVAGVTISPLEILADQAEISRSRL